VNSKSWGHLALLTVGATYAANYLLAKGIMPDLIQPSGFIFARVTGALLLFFPLLLILGFEKIKKEHLGRVILCGVFGVASNQLLFFNGLNLTSPLNASLILTATPIIVLITSSILLKTKITALKVTGVLLGAIGASLLIYLGKGESNGGNSSALGDLLVLLNATSYSIYLVIVKPLMKHYKPITVITWVFLSGWFIVALFGFNEFTETNWALFQFKDYMILLFVVVMVTFLVYLLNIFALKHLPPTTVSVYIYLQPLLVIAFTFLFFHLGLEDYRGDLTWQKLICALCIFLGVYLVSINPKKAELAEKG